MQPYESIYDHLEDVGQLDTYLAALANKDIQTIDRVLRHMGYDPQPYIEAALKWGDKPNPDLI